MDSWRAAEQSASGRFTFKLTTNDIMGNKERVSITYKNLIHDVKAGTRMLIDDGLIEMLVTNVTETEITL